MQDARLEYEIRVSAEVTAYLSMRARGSFRRDKSYFTSYAIWNFASAL